MKIELVRHTFSIIRYKIMSTDNIIIHIDQEPKTAGEEISWDCVSIFLQRD